MDAEPIVARHDAVIERLTRAARDDERIVAAWLQGSRADGSADAYSDIDIYLAIRDEAYADFDKIAFIERAAPVLVHATPPGLPGVVCLLAGPVKLDLLVEKRSAVAGPARPAVAMLVDKAALESELRIGVLPSEEEVARDIDMILRMTFQGATWPIRLLGRGQWMTHAYSELVLINNVIVAMMLATHDRRAFQRNPMTRERLLTDEERREVDALSRDVLRALSGRSLAEAYRAHMRIAETLGRVGRAACAAFGLEFPEAAEREVMRFYEREWPA